MFVRTLCQLAIGVVLARMLGPEPFGVVAIAWLVISACNLIADFGLGAALVQRHSLIDQDVRFVFTCQIAVGAALTLVGVAASEPIAVFFRLTEGAAPLRAMFFLFVLQSLGQTSAALLRRSLDFRYVQKVTIASYLLGYLVVGVSAAALGLGVWALVAANLIQTSTASVGYLLRSRAKLGWSARPASPGLFAFGGKVVAANLTSWAIANLDSLAAGRMLGVTELGLYNRAMMLVSSPMSAFVSGLQSVLFSACSRAQDRPDQLRRAYLGATSAVALVSLPLFLSIAAVADTVMVGLYGGQWRAASGPLLPLAVAMPLMALLALAGPVLMSMDKVAQELKAQAATVALMLPLLYWAAQQSTVAIAWAMLLVYAIRWTLLARAILVALSIPLSQLLRAIAMPTTIAAGVVVTVWCADQGLRTMNMGASWRLVALTPIGTAALLAGLRVLGPRLLRDDLGHFLRARGPLPPALSRFLNIKP